MFHPTLGALVFTLLSEKWTARVELLMNTLSVAETQPSKTSKTSAPRRLMQHLPTGKLALDVVQQSWLQTARLHYFIDLSPSMRHVAWQVAILISFKSCWVKDVMGCLRFSKWVKYPCNGGLAMHNITLSLGVSATSTSWTMVVSAQGWTDQLLRQTQA